GSTFYFDLPLNVAEPDAGAPPAASESAAAKRVLLWSSSRNHRDACASLLGELGLEVELLPADLSRALPEVDPSSNSQLVIDVPAAGGIPFDPDQLRSRLGLAHSQVIVLLPAGQTEAVDVCNRSGLTRCITKPARASELAALLHASDAANAE